MKRTTKETIGLLARIYKEIESIDTKGHFSMQHEKLMALKAIEYLKDEFNKELLGVK